MANNNSPLDQPAAGELTLEETKKVETFTKTLLLLKGRDSKEDDKDKESTKQLTTAQLLKLVSKDIEQ